MLRKKTQKTLSLLFSLILTVSVMAPMAMAASSHAFAGREVSVVAMPGTMSDADLSSAAAAPSVSVPTGFTLDDEAKEESKTETKTETKTEYVPTFGYNVEKKASTVNQSILDSYKGMGRYKLSFYCACRKCNGNSHGITASGTHVTEGRTIAVDSRKIPLGSVVHIDGFGDFIAEDTGSAIKGNRIDIFVGSHSEALSLGIKYADVYVKR